MRRSVLGLLSIAMLLSGVWAVMALHYQLPLAAPWRIAAGVAWALFALAATALVWRGHAGRAALSYGIAFALLLGWWVRIEPSENRVWADDVSRHLQAQRQGDILTLANVRNFDWRTDTDYTPRWETRTYDLARLRSVDMAASYWMGPAIAHTLVSFGFDDGKGGRNSLFSPSKSARRRERRSRPSRASSSASNSAWSPPTSATSSACGPTSVAKTCFSIA